MTKGFRLTLVLGAAGALAVLVVGSMRKNGQQSLSQSEDPLRQPPPVTAEAQAVAPAKPVANSPSPKPHSIIESRRLDVAAPSPGSAGSPAPVPVVHAPDAVAFARDNSISSDALDSLAGLNEAWTRILKEAAASGDTSRIDELAPQIARKLQIILGDQQKVEKYRLFEGAATGERIDVRGKDGTVYHGVAWK